MGVSMNVRPRVVEEKDLRLGFGQGFTRDVAQDFAFASPTTEKAETPSPALLSELSVHYGISKHADVGVRLRPIARGMKLEWQYQLLDPRGDAVGLAIGVGLDGFFRSRLQLGCEDHGCFYRKYGGAIADLPIILSRRTVHWMTLFVAVKPEFLFIKGRQTYRADDGSFPTLKVEKTATQPVGGWTAGLLFEWAIVRMIPQVNGVTIRGPDEKYRHAIYPSLDFGLEW
jgi:hypothetical protein